MAVPRRAALVAPVAALVVTLSKPIDPSTLSTSALALTLNGGPNLITNILALRSRGHALAKGLKPDG